VDQFQRRPSVVEYNRASLKQALKTVKKFAELEGLRRAWEKCGDKKINFETMPEELTCGVRVGLANALRRT